MTPEFLALLCAALFLVALLYSSVGHAGASGYIAVMSLLGLAPAVIKPTALALNILVALVAAWQFWRAGHFRWALFWPFAVTAVPAAFVGGWISLPTRVFTLLLGLVLLWSAWRFFFEPKAPQVDAATSASVLSAVPVERAVPRTAALASGAGIGLLSGLTGTGGGIFLTPLLLMMGWAQPKNAAAVSALFILMNSTSGLLGNWASTRNLPDELPMLLAAVLVGGAIGSFMGSRRLPAQQIKRLLAVVLVIAGLKLLFT
ncbi:MAG: sulfite exporter TauE/SafE family protein [Gammaproteobacteria bacterium]